MRFGSDHPGGVDIVWGLGWWLLQVSWRVLRSWDVWWCWVGGDSADCAVAVWWRWWVAWAVVIRVLAGDCRDVLAGLPANSVHCCVTSPPYYGLRDYGTAQWDGGDVACDHVGPPMRTNNKPVDNTSAFHLALHWATSSTATPAASAVRCALTGRSGWRGRLRRIWRRWLGCSVRCGVCCARMETYLGEYRG